MRDYLRRHHLALVAIFLALGGTSLAAIDPIGSDGDIDACFERQTGDLDLLKGKKCGKGEKPVAWGTVGPPGPAGAPGQDGANGADGSARAYGLVQPSGVLTHGKNATVTRPQTAIFCIAVPGASPATTPLLLTVDSQSSTMQYGTASLNATDQTTDDPMDPNGSVNPIAVWDATPSVCPAGQYEVHTAEQRVDAFSNTVSMAGIANAGFAFAVP